ncbi:MAG: DUF3006 domain-containing protein [Proteobacteria bacterium]|nr:DUF3006 domain-containing protein [Pseudomonadota bacterium]
MAHLWMNLLAGFLTALFHFSGEDDVLRISGNHQELSYVVVERFEGIHAVLEAESGSFRIPRTALPDGADREGTVLEWRVSEREMDRRLGLAHARLEKMKSESMLNIEL